MSNERNGNGLAELERRLWAAADQLWANSPLRPSEYSTPVLGLIFLRFADNAFTKIETELKGKSTGRRTIGKTDYQAKGAVYIPAEARFSKLLQLPESADLGKHLNEAMKAIEKENDDLKDVLPKSYQRIDNATLVELLKIMSGIPLDLPGDAFGKIYEYFLSSFAMKEGQKGGEFFTPPSMVDLIVDIIEPFHGRVFDPACGSGGMFVSSARYVLNHKKNPNEEISIFGQERVYETIRLCKMNLAVHGLSGDIRSGNSYNEDVHDCVGKFDYVMANPPFNVSGVDKEKIKDDPRFRFGLPSTDIANYLWIQIFYHALSPKGRAGFVMANSAADARGSELEIRKKLIQSGVVDVMVSIGPSFFIQSHCQPHCGFSTKASRSHSRQRYCLLTPGMYTDRLTEPTERSRQSRSSFWQTLQGSIAAKNRNSNAAVKSFSKKSFQNSNTPTCRGYAKRRRGRKLKGKTGA